MDTRCKYIHASLLFFIFSISTHAYAVDWQPVPNLAGYSFDNDSLMAGNANSHLWIKDNNTGGMEHIFIDCEKRTTAQIINNTTLQNINEIRPGSQAEKLLSFCKKKWEFWK